MSGDTEKREGFEKWIEKLANYLRTGLPDTQSAYEGVLRRELLPLLEAAENAAHFHSNSTWTVRLRAELDKLKGK